MLYSVLCCGRTPIINVAVYYQFYVPLSLFSHSVYNGNEFFGLHSKGKLIELLLLKEIADFQNVVTIIETW